MGNISRSFYNDLKSARRQQRNDQKRVVAVQLTKAGTPYKHPEATHYFSTIEQCNEYIARINELNPGSNIRFQVTVK